MLKYNIVVLTEPLVESGGWREVVDGWGELGERLSQQQSAIWELVETEATYCQMITVITNVSIVLIYYAVGCYQCKYCLDIELY